MRLTPRTPMFLLALAPLALAGAVAGPAAGATAVPGTAADCSAWNGAQPVAPAPVSQLDGIAVVSACDVWGVGASAGSGGSIEQTVIEHWTGSSWATVPSFSSSSGLNLLAGVSAVSASDIWAAGYTSAGTLIMHYDGTGWTRRSTPHDGDSSQLFAVDGRTASDAWAGGNANGSTTRNAMMMHWDGANWTPSILPPAATGDGTRIIMVSADSATDAWAVDNTFSNSSMLLHWDGTQWTASTAPGPATTVISSVVALSPTSVWVVGQ
jgi:hypothetical protein